MPLSTKPVRWLLLLVFLAAVLSSCAPASPPTTPPPPPTPTPTTAPSMQPDAAPLSETGPWLLVANALDGRTVDSLWALNPGGSGLTRLVADAVIVGPHEFPMAASPLGGHVAYVTADDTQWHNLTLNLLSLPSGETQTITPLTSAQTEPPPDAPTINDPAYDAAFAIAGVDRNLAWSPDGRQLAFVSAHQGSSADLYIYTPGDDTITRLTDEPGQAMLPYWSPGGETILYMTYETFSTTGGFGSLNVWAARADGSTATKLYDPGPSIRDEQFVAWLSGTTFLVYSGDSACGWRNLRTVDVNTGEERALWPSYFNKVSLDPNTGTLLVAVNQYTSVCDEAISSGLFRLTLADPTPARITDFAPMLLAWSGVGAFYAVTADSEIFQITPTGQVTRLAGPLAFVPILSPDFTYWAWAGQQAKYVAGLWLGPTGQEPVRAYQGAVQAVTWTPDSRALFFVGDNTLYRIDRAATPPEPQLITPDVVLRDFRGLAWLSP